MKNKKNTGNKERNTKEFGYNGKKNKKIKLILFA